MESNFSIQSYTNSGEVITKRELLMYFSKVLHALNDFQHAMERKNERYPKIKAAEIEVKRRTFVPEYREPPRGFASLSIKRRRAYQRWLEDAPQREREMALKEIEEDKRVAAVTERLNCLRTEQENDAQLVVTSRKEYESLKNAGIIDGELYNPTAITLIAKYLLCNRAHTLTDAINLYYQEQHWMRMENTAAEQKRELLAQQRRMMVQQQEHMAEMRRVQEQQGQEMRESLDATRKAAEDAKFYSEMNFLFTIFDER